MIKFERISNPPRGSAVAMERTYDFVEFAGSSAMSFALTDEQREQFLSSPVGRWASLFLAVWKTIVFMFIAVGVILPLAGLAILWFAVREQPDADPWHIVVFAVALLGFLLVSVVAGLWVVARMRRSKQNAGTLSRTWTLRITRAWVEFTEKEMGPDRSNVCRPEEVQSISVGHDGVLVAQLAKQSSQEHPEMLLTGPLEPRDAGWLQAALVQLLGLDDIESSS